MFLSPEDREKRQYDWIKKVYVNYVCDTTPECSYHYKRALYVIKIYCLKAIPFFLLNL